MELSGTLEGGVHRLDVRVYYEDTDFSGRVYHANYLKFCERGRSDFLRLIGIYHTELAKDGLGFVVRRMECDFLGAAGIDDTVQVETRSKQVSGVRAVLHQQVLLAGKMVFAADVTVALINAKGRPVRFSPEMAARLAGE